MSPVDWFVEAAEVAVAVDTFVSAANQRQKEMHNVGLLADETSGPVVTKAGLKGQCSTQFDGSPPLVGKQ